MEIINAEVRQFIGVDQFNDFTEKKFKFYFDIEEKKDHLHNSINEKY